MNWSAYWSGFITNNKLSDKIHEMDEIDMDINGRYQIEEICHKIYNGYGSYKSELDRTRLELLKKIEEFPGVHLQTSRVKTLDSLLKKVIEKRHAHLRDKSSRYSKITGENYKDILTDLVGIRLIISYRGRWIDLHERILEVFPYVPDMQMYHKYKLIPHSMAGNAAIAEIPKVYHAFGDDISEYEKAGLESHLKENGYRSIHYVVSFMKTYIEIQTRTIYDEAWSDCDHNFVYKHDAHRSHAALKEMSDILCLLTNAANDWGEMIQEIYETEAVYVRDDGKYQKKQGFDLPIETISDKIDEIHNLLEQFQKRIQ